MQLPKPEASSDVKHFSIIVERIDEPVVEDSKYETLFIDYYFEVIVVYDGQGKYGSESYICILISQKTDHCDNSYVPSENKDGTARCIVLEKDEVCTGLSVVEGKIEDISGVLLLMGIRNTKTNEKKILAFQIKEPVR